MTPASYLHSSLKLHDFVMTPLGEGRVVNFVHRSDEVTAVLVLLEGTENVDTNWRAFRPEEVTKTTREET